MNFSQLCFGVSCNDDNDDYMKMKRRVVVNFVDGAGPRVAPVVSQLET